MRRLLRLAAALPLLCASACVVGPMNYDIVCGRDAEVVFKGYSIKGGQKVEIQTAPSSAGPWTTVAVTTTAESGVVIEGATLYPWSVTTTLDNWEAISYWPTGLGPLWWATHVRAILEGSHTLPTFDSDALGWPNGVECIEMQVAGGAGLGEAVINCQSSESPVLTIGANWNSTCPCDASEVDYVGDIDIVGEYEDQYHCVETLEGNLTVEAGGTLPVSLPDLRAVDGNVALDFTHPSATSSDYQRPIGLDALEKVSGDLELIWDNTSIPGPTIQWGLDAVLEVGGTVSVDVHSVNYTMAGLGALEHHAGDFAIVGSVGDVAGSSFAPNLTSIGGDLLFEPGYTVSWMFEALEWVGGDVTLDGGNWNPPNAGFHDLSAVGGSLTLRDMTNSTSYDLLPSLTDVGGTLVLDETGFFGTASLRTEDLSVGALVIQNNANLGALDGDWSVNSDGDIEISDNPALQTCEAETFVSLQGAQGWDGAATISGNQGPSCP